MKRLIHSIVLALAIASCTSTAYGSTMIKTKSFPYVVGAVQFPQNKTTLVRHSFRMQIPKGSSAVSQLTIDVPKGLAVKNDINVSDQSGKKIVANIADNGRTITIAFPQPISPGTNLNIDLNRVSILEASNAWLYPVFVRLVGLNGEIPVGVFRIGVF